MITENEKEFITTLEEFRIKSHDAIIYIKEKYGVDSEMDENGQINLDVNSVDDPMKILAAKNYLYENLNNDFLTTNLDEKIVMV